MKPSPIIKASHYSQQEDNTWVDGYASVRRTVLTNRTLVIRMRYEYLRLSICLDRGVQISIGCQLM